MLIISVVQALDGELLADWRASGLNGWLPPKKWATLATAGVQDADVDANERPRTACGKTQPVLSTIQRHKALAQKQKI